jgi:hypothetical protein
MENASSTRLPVSIFVSLTLIAAYQAAYDAAHLTDVVATHFAGGGRANGWQTRSGFFDLEVAVIAGACLICFGIPRLISVVPVAMINLPNKEFWLAPERREQTLGTLRAHFGWFGCAFLTFLLIVNELVFRANQTSPPQLNTTAFVTTLMTFLTFVAIWVIRMILRFSRPPR